MHLPVLAKTDFDRIVLVADSPQVEGPLNSIISLFFSVYKGLTKLRMLRLPV